MHKDWKTMFAAAITGVMARNDDDADDWAVVADAARVADYACKEIDRRESDTKKTEGFSVHLPPEMTGDEMAEKLRALLAQIAA